MKQLPLIIRQARRSSQQALLFIFCAALSLAALTAFSGFSAAVGRALLNDARGLQGGDILVSSYDPISAPLEQAIQGLERAGRATRTTVHRFFSVVRTARGEASLLSSIKVVGPQYPFYGQVVTASGQPFGRVLSPGSAIVEQVFLDRIGLTIGDTIRVGYAALTIVDVVLSEPDRSFNFFSFGPRVFVHAEDLDALGLIETGSRIRRTVLLKIPEADQLDNIADALKRVANPDQEQVNTFLTAGSRIKRFLDNFFFFLNLVGLFILLLAGLGMQGTLTALLRQKQRTIAIMKTIGAANATITLHFIGLLGLLGAIGTAAGLLCGIGLQKILGMIMAPFLPVQLTISISWQGVLEGVILGAAAIALFSFLPMFRIREMRPMILFRGGTPAISRRWPYYAYGAMMVLFFFALVMWHMRDFRFGIYFIAGIGGLILLSALLSRVLLWAISRRPARRLVLRQAVRGLFRKAGATRSIIVTLTASLAIIFANYLIERNLDATFVKSYPEDAPNVFFVDIQPHQSESFKEIIAQEVELYPIVRARVAAVNGEAIDRDRERRQRRDNLSRVFNLTYRHRLLEDETIIKGKQLFRDDWEGPQVSILDTVAQMRRMTIGDTIAFKIQGVPLSARIASIRTRDASSFRPFFYFVFPEETLKSAPHTLFAAVSIDPQQLGATQSRLVERFPNISVIDMTKTIGVFATLMNQLSSIIRAFSMLSIAAGLLILVSAVYATRAERVLEAVYYKVMGAGKSFVWSVFALENAILGLLSSAMALLMAQAGAYWICRIKLDIAYQPLVLDSLLMIAATLVLVTAVGLVASRSILEKKPIVYLREQPDG